MDDNKKSTGGFGRFLLVLAAVCLGGITLGGGMGAGYAVVVHLLPQSAVISDMPTEEEEVQAAFSFDHESAAVIPIQVQTGTFSEIVKSVKDSVVSINVVATVSSWFGGTREAEGAGSGFIFAMDDKSVYIATNNHVIEDVNAVSISLDDDTHVEAKIVGRDRDSDLAVLSVPKAIMDALEIPYTVAKIGDSDGMRVGDSVVAIGNALGEGQTATSGIISATNREITVERRKLNVMQTDAAINRGNSGGPLVNTDGEVIAINTAKLYASGVEGMGYSLPINEALVILNELLEDGTAEKPFLGVEYRTLDEETKELFNLPSTGVIFRDILPGSAAEKAGLLPRDILVAFDGKPIRVADDLLEAILSCKVGDTVKLEVYRGNDRMEFVVTIGNRNE